MAAKGFAIENSEISEGMGTMRNILSYEPRAKFSGQEILDWAKYQIENGTSHAKYGEVILRRFGNLKPEKMYHIETNHRGTASGEIVKKPRILNVIEV